MARQIIVDIVGDSSKLGSALDSATGKAGGFKNILTGIGQGIGQAGFGLIDSAASKLIGTLGDAAAAFREDQASVNLLGTALANNIPGFDGNTTAIEANISAWQAKGVNDEMQRQGLTTLLNKTQDLTAAQQLNNAAIELAAGTGKTYDEAIAEITSGLNGKVAALHKDGVAIDKNMTATELATTILDKYGGSQDKVAATSDGKMKISQEKVGEAMEKLGGIVDKVASVALPILADAFGTVIDIVTKVIDTISPVIEQVMPHLQNAVKVVGDVFSAVFPVIQSVVQTVFGVIGTAIQTFQKGLDTAAAVTRTVVDVLSGLFSGLGKLIGGVFDGIVGVIRGAINGVIGAINVAIDGINAIPDLDVGDVHIGIPHLDHIPTLHQGGLIPGLRGTEVPILAQAGERVIPLDQVANSGSSNNTFNITLNVTSNDPDAIAKAVVLPLRRELTRTGMSLA